MRVYADSSALIKRVVAEVESDALEARLERHAGDGDALVASSLAWIEIGRALRSRLDGEDPEVVTLATDDAMAGIAERPMTGDVVGLARRIGPGKLRSHDAIHLATAVLLDVDVLVTYDIRLAAAGREAGLPVSAPA